MKRLPLLVVLGLLIVAVAVPMSGSELGFGATQAGPTASPGAETGADTALGTLDPNEGSTNEGSQGETAAGSDAPPGEPEGSVEPAAPTQDAPASPAASPTETPLPIADVPIVPVTHFRSARTRSSTAEVARILAGQDERYEAIELVAGEADAILDALRIEVPDDERRLILAKGPVTLSRDLAKHRDRLGFLRVDDVTPGVRALAWGGRTFFGVDRIDDLADWRLTARLPAAPADQAFDPNATWTLFAAGDVMLDRGVYQTLRINGKGADFPFDGGSAEITSRYCCSSFGWRLPRTQRTGDRGAMRDLVKSADLAIANFENPAPNQFRYHTSGTVFSADPKLIAGLRDGGIDWVSLANNHIGDAGDRGITQTIRNLKKYDIAASGAGKDRAAARTPSVLDAGGMQVAFLAYDTIARYYAAGADSAGSARMTIEIVTKDVKKARAAGADVVIVFPHWGTEYDATPFPRQQALARAAIDAGADMVIGNHAHWAAAMEIHEDKPIWYALGNYIFDQTWSELTMEGITLELTFHGKELVQARMRPHIILDKAQPNFLDPAGDGRVVLGQIYDASDATDLLPW